MTYHYYLGECCRIWLLVGGARVGTCGICGEIPTYLRDAIDSDLLAETRTWPFAVLHDPESTK